MNTTSIIPHASWSKRALAGMLSALLLIAVSGCQERQPPKSEELLTGEFPTSRASNTVTIFSTAGVKTTEIFSDSVINFAEKDSTQAYEVRVNFYDDAGKWTSVLTADSGVIREKSEHLEVFGKVNVTTRDSIRLKTAQLAWDPSRSKIVSDSFVVINKGGDIMRGWGMISDPDLKNITILRSTGEMKDVEEVIDSL
jgi:LPS export ABC transporter protein LptC